MSFKNAKQRGAVFEKLKQKNTAPNLNPIKKMEPIKPLNGFEKLKRTLKMPKVGN